MMPLSQARRARRALIAASVSALCALTLAQACERPSTKTGDKPVEPAPKTDSPGSPDQAQAQAQDQDQAQGDAASQGSSKASQKAALPKDNTIAPTDLGPPAPALFVMTGLKGYTEPCGCTLDIMLGGIDRVVGYVQAARKLYPDAVVLDAGDMLFEEATIAPSFEPMERRKAKLLMQAQRALGTRHTVPGRRDLALGAPFYQAMLKEAQIEPLAVNLTWQGPALKPWTMIRLEAPPGGQAQSIAVLGAVDPSRYEGVPGVTAQPLMPALKSAIAQAKAKKPDAIIVLFYGEGAQARQLLEEHPEVDFVVVGLSPRETDQADAVGQGFTLEPHDQGRYLGILKLYPAAGDDTYQSARQGSKTELETLKAQLAHVDKSIASVSASVASGQPEPALLGTLRARRAALAKEQAAIESAPIELPAHASAFIWRSVPMEPGLPVDASIQQARGDYNRALKADVPDLPIPEVAAGQPFYVGSTQCQSCHSDAYALWTKTPHGRAMDTLVERDKDFDPKCVSCHVVGYERPGGSVVGKLQVEGVLRGEPILKELRHVGCENCHGPGSAHIEAVYSGGDAKAKITRQVTEQTCAGGCHVPEHSPRFKFEEYLPRVLGPGHGQPLP